MADETAAWIGSLEQFARISVRLVLLFAALYPFFDPFSTRACLYAACADLLLPSLMPDSLLSLG